MLKKGNTTDSEVVAASTKGLFGASSSAGTGNKFLGSKFSSKMGKIGSLSKKLEEENKAFRKKWTEMKF